jgi:hypothetical protein
VVVIEESLTKQAKRLEKYILTLPTAKQLNKLTRSQQDAMMKLRDHAYIARKAVEVYSSSDNTKEQVRALEEAIEHLTETGKSILVASNYDLLDVTDVAHLSALNERIIDQLK